MRNSRLAGAVLLLSIVAALVPLAATAAGLKVGYVNVVRVIEQAPQAKSALKRLEAEFAPRDKKLVEMRARIKRLEAELEQNMLAMKSAERRAKERELLTLKRDLRRATQEFREDYNLRRNEELAALQKLVYKTIVNIAKARHFDLILHEGTVYASDKIDITDLVLKDLSRRMNKN